jgi:hypothetical protein
MIGKPLYLALEKAVLEVETEASYISTLAGDG